MCLQAFQQTMKQEELKEGMSEWSSVVKGDWTARMKTEKIKNE